MKRPLSGLDRAYDLVAASRVIVEGYPRDRFGSFMLNTEVVACVDAKLRYLHSYKGKDEELFSVGAYHELYSMWRTPMTTGLSMPNGEHWDYHDRAAAQVYVLWARTPSDPMSRIKGIGSGAMGLNEHDGVGTAVGTEWFNRYWTLYDRPDFLPYYEAGIFDPSLIGNAISNGLDPQLAVSVGV